MHIHRAIIRGFDPSTWRANVELLGAHTALLAGVPVAADLAPDLLAPGTRVWLCLSDEGNPDDGAVLAPYGCPPAPWVTSRLWKPTLAGAERADPLGCTSATPQGIPGLSLTVTVEVASSVLLLVAATGYLAGPGLVYTLAFYHDDAHEATLLAPAGAVGGPAAGAGERWALTWLAWQEGVGPGTHTFAVRHSVSAGQAVLEGARASALAMGRTPTVV